VLLVTVDTLRADHLSCYLYARPTSATPTTPEEKAGGGGWSIDRLAAEGVLFSQAFAPRGETFPSVSTLLTGRSPFEHGAIDNLDVLSEEVETLAERFKAAGFATGAFTTNRLLGPAVDQNGRPGRPSGIEQGFDHFEHLFAAPDRDLAAIAAAVKWSQARRAEGDPPQFLWLHLMGPHLPYDPAPLHGRDFARLFADPDYAGKANGSREFLDPLYSAGTPLDPLDLHQVVALYDGEIARVNYLLGLFWMTLFTGPGGPEAKQQTLIVFAADHGEELYQRNGYWGHSKSVYSSVLHVPLILWHPPSLTGSRVLGEVVGLADVAPTLCDWFGLPELSGQSGRSLLPLVDSYIKRPFERRPAIGQWSDRIFSVADERWRLVWNPTGIEPDDPPPGRYPIPALALFDRQRDPLELNDLSAQRPEERQRLLDLLEEFAAAAPAGQARGGPLDPARRDSLIELGYTTRGEAGTDSSSATGAKDGVQKPSGDQTPAPEAPPGQAAGSPESPAPPPAAPAAKPDEAAQPPASAPTDGAPSANATGAALPREVAAGAACEGFASAATGAANGSMAPASARADARAVAGSGAGDRAGVCAVVEAESGNRGAAAGLMDATPHTQGAAR
jgi:arylsulfatase A-like enzyme